VNQNKVDMRQTFTRMVAESLKPPDEPGLLPDSQGAIGGAPISANQQYQQLTPQQQMQQQQQQQSAMKGPAPLMRPPMNGPPLVMSHQMMQARPGSNQQPPVSVTPPQEIQHQMLGVNLSIPPPQLPGRANNQTVYSPAQQQPQHPTHPAPHLPQTPSQQQPQPVRQHMSPAMPTPLQQVQLQAQQSPHHLPSQQSPHHLPSQSPHLLHQPLLNQVPHAAQNQSPPYSQISSPSMTVNPAQQISNMGVNSAAQHLPPTNLAGNPSEHQMRSGMAVHPTVQPLNQVDLEKPKPQMVKDGRRGKKNLKGLNSKDISGSDMDAFFPNSKPSTHSQETDTAVNGAGGLPVKQALVEERETKQDTSKGLESPQKDRTPAPES
ncbi:unnamed protein product, partial [Candidula unifasciata]